jgi:hypothetical protein
MGILVFEPDHTKEIAGTSSITSGIASIIISNEGLSHILVSNPLIDEDHTGAVHVS